MAKRKSDVDASVHRQPLCDAQTDNSTAKSQPRQKRKRSPDDQSDNSEPREAKRARKSPCLSPSSSGPTDRILATERNPHPEESEPLRQFVNEMYGRDVLLHEETDSDAPSTPDLESPSPSPSDSADPTMASWPLRECNPRPIEASLWEQFCMHSHADAVRLHQEYDVERPSTPEAYRLHSPPSSPAVSKRRDPLTRNSFGTSEEPEIPTSPSELPKPILPQWPRISSPPPLRKSVYALSRECDDDTRATSPNRLGKRKRVLDSQFGISEESGAKRARTSPSESPEPTIDDNVYPEEPNGSGQWYIRTDTGLVALDEYASDASADHETPLPSSRLHGRGAAGSVHARHPTPAGSKVLSPRRPKKLETLPPRRKRRQPPKRGKDESKQNKPRGEPRLLVVEIILRSKRSSRRDLNCKLWQLGDDGTACTVSRVR
ncbi:uncharacterized protein TRIVIDRAFT_201282 [Trichoderma virens Gv29-8]|uniref:Uncharacterized protein n=1 Tax=Hypocrea virens (strain Gv29-8 / FGSC 10586) TaxID=413071 RepID=G9MSL4_HYPVG|nr:uncharacterized protein TRIVIDRAFT_201282 [Trichoderma virens Gv29-8]EHK23017.1 hypothetical protein TRIVIDRAFT_201282 [Trichoderma virens Gv29-8]